MSSLIQLHVLANGLEVDGFIHYLFSAVCLQKIEFFKIKENNERDISKEKINLPQMQETAMPTAKLPFRK